MVEREENRETGLNRRHFIGGAAALAGAALVASCAREEPWVAPGPKMVPGPRTAPDGAPLRAAVIGCGGRGTGAAMNFLDAGPNLEIVALHDVFQDRIDNCRRQLRERKGVEIPDDKCFSGFDGYHDAINAGVDYVIIATPPFFRPAQLRAAIEARKHVFMEKPVAVDPVGARHIMDSADRADAFGLKVATGTQRRHQRSYVETYNRIMDGAIGEVVAARCYWNQSQLWYRDQQPEWSEMEWMIRDWVNWCWLSGDHIVEQHIHNIDVINWFTHSHPVTAVGVGGRHRRVTGDQYDFFAVDFAMENGVRVLSMCRQIDGCVNNVSEYIVGTRGSSNCADKIFAPNGDLVWEFQPETERETDAPYDQGADSPYVQTHIDLVSAIRLDQPLNEARDTAVSTLTAVMGRISAYTGQQITWDEMMASDLKLGPEELVMGPSDIQPIVPVPGLAQA
jgi:myo-inositol 2-dehydrogenase / D-chiro-inositol 1-dehydrogenase